MIHVHLKDKTIIEGDIGAISHGYNLGKKIMKQKTEKVYGIDAVTKKKVFIHEMPKDNTQEIEQKELKQEKGKEGKPLLSTGKVTPSPSDINCQDCNCCKAQNHLCHACLSVLRSDIEKESIQKAIEIINKSPKNIGGYFILKADNIIEKLNQGLKDVCNDKIKLGYFKTGYGQGIQKAIDIVEDLKKSVEEVGYENLSDQSYYNALCDVKIQLNQEVKHE